MKPGKNWQRIWDIMSNVKYEYELYAPMCQWLEQRLQDKYKGEKCKIIVEDTHSVTLDSVLIRNNLIAQYPQAVGLDIQIDVLGMVVFEKKSELFFIEAKKTMLNLHDLGQLWAYCKLINPSSAFLLSSQGLGCLDKILKNLKREDMLDFGNGKILKKMYVGKWDVQRNTVDNNSIVPKI